MARRRPNGYGGITKLSGKRRKPYIAYVSEMVTKGVVDSGNLENTLSEAKNALLDASTQEDIYVALARAYYELDKIAEKVPGLDECRDSALKALEEKAKELTIREVQVKRRLGSYASYPEAEIALAEYNKNPYDIMKKAPTFAQLYPKMKEEKGIEEKSVSTQNAYKQGYDKCEAIHNRPINELKLEELQAVLKEYEGMSASTQKAPLTVIREVFQYALKHDWIEKDYSIYLKTGKVAEVKGKNAYTRHEVKKVWESIDWTYTPRKYNSPWYGLEISKMILVLIYTGMRIDELISLKKKDVHIEEGYIDVVEAKTEAGRRLIPIHDAILPIVKEFYEKNKKFLIENKAGQLSYMSLTESPIKTFYKDMGFEHTLHETRHSFATFTLSSKLDATLRAFIMGHRTNNLTNDVYSHPEVLLTELKEEMQKLTIVSEYDVNDKEDENGNKKTDKK